MSNVIAMYKLTPDERAVELLIDLGRTVAALNDLSPSDIASAIVIRASDSRTVGGAEAVRHAREALAEIEAGLENLFAPSTTLALLRQGTTFPSGTGDDGAA